MKYSPGNLKPLVVAISAIPGILHFHPVLAKTTIISISITNVDVSGKI